MLISVYGAQATQEATDLLATATLSLNCTDTVQTATQYTFLQTIFCDLNHFKESLAADRQLYQQWNNSLVDLGNSLQVHHEQQTAALHQVKSAILQLKQVISQQEQQGQDYLMTINALSEQLYALQKQTDQEILALQKQLDETNQELDLLEDEYGEFIDASFAHTQAFYNMLQLAKQEYTALLGERTQFFNALQLLTDKLHSQDEQGTAQIYDLLASLAADSN